ncbi:uroporphyrinogen-III C-methyltransferase [Noviherbaspirillum sp. UKPF54]|uniref:uroporphyrinogen-III C-methyltransferase n=1 Tax=Noviherbaspirillum sp. UKPF54 TaxID=2601898 RepID=UPI0011B19A01|nr:uroporphyrinogen-III C-methyltransferase [Noviherbaspirillum sp. UKPF54]QDZ28391.1 hypothetical protein FAY22_10795 [Noviherbaspirillum sp. UKPF54]
MNELPSSNNSTPSGGASPAPQLPLQTETGSGHHRLNRPVYAALGVLGFLLAAQWWSSNHEISSLREEMAQRLKTGESINAETKVLVKSMQDSMRDMQAKVNVLEGKQVEAQGQQLALEQMYQELSKNRDDWALAEIEQVLSTASQQLQLAGNVQGALIALQNADNRLSRSDKPQFIVIRRALARDMERLKLLPNIDLPGIALRLDSLIGQIDSMPLLADEKPALPATQPKTSRRASKSASAAKAPANAGNSAADWFSDLEDRWNSWTNEVWTELKQMVRVRNVETPDALLLSPTQAYYARENVKLRLLNARMALLTRNEAMFRSDLLAAQDAISRYFDTRAKQTQTALALLRQVQSSNLSIDMPTLADSLNAVRNYKAKP